MLDRKAGVYKTDCKIHLSLLSVGNSEMKIKYPDLPQGVFDINEVSAGMYKIVGVDPAGYTIAINGIDPDMIIEKCRQEVQKYLRNSKNPSC